MIDILHLPDTVKVVCEEEPHDASVRFVPGDHRLEILLTAKHSHPKTVMLRWNIPTDEPVRVLGDAWERTYSENGWMPLHTERFLPWYFLAKNDSEVVGCGVMTAPHAFVSFEYDADGVTAWCDVRCGGVGVELGERELPVATFVCEHYTGISAFEAAKRFCRVMHPAAAPVQAPVYGGNNWYYAYSNTSRERVLKDAALMAELSEGLENRPFMVIDSGWEAGWKYNQGPWHSNYRFGDMRSLADEIKAMGVKPGIWLRPLDEPVFADEHIRCVNEHMHKLDPSHPETQEFIRKTFRRVKEWGYELVKHDFTFFDMFGKWGFEMGGALGDDGWSFYDKSKTGAEICLDFYRLIREETEGMTVIACNVASHLAAGLIDCNRIADDTSGRNWSRTMVMGVHGLAFRLPQNHIFYGADADCAGILGDCIPWELNSQWIDLLAHSGAPFFISCEPETVSDEVKAALKEAFCVASEQKDVAEPLDWEYNMLPARWNINGEEKRYFWTKGTVPVLLNNKKRNY